MKHASFLFLPLFSILTLVTFNAQKEVTYKVDNEASKVFWKAKKVTGEHSGYISISTGVLNVANGQLKGGNIEINTQSITVTDIADATSNARLVGHLKGEDFFAVEKFPTATLVITSATSTGTNSYDIKGKLSIKGVTNEVSFPATIGFEKNKLSAKAQLTVDRTKYDIRYRSKNFFENLGDKAIYDDFELDITLSATLGTSPNSKAK